MNKFLEADEKIEKVISKRKYLPLRNEDWIKIPMFIFFVFFSFLFTNNWNLKNNVNIFTFTFIALFLFFLIKIINNYYKRYLNAFIWKLIITNKRLIIIDHYEKVIKSYFFNQFPEILYEENAYGNGCIIIGKKEPLFGVSKSMTHYRVGVNFDENDTILYNIENVKDVFNELSSKINNSKIA